MYYYVFKDLTFICFFFQYFVLFIKRSIFIINFIIVINFKTEILFKNYILLCYKRFYFHLYFVDFVFI
jgi:hypothetical protein